MKYFFTILFIFFYFTSLATNYYFSASGNDAAAGTLGAPWQSIAKFNSVFASRAPGDFMLFNRGDVFYGKMVVSRNGSSGSPITIGAYGSGANPVITGFTTVSAWTNLGANIWESTSAVSTLSTCNMVVINGVNYAMGRFPNAGYFTYQSFTGSTSITSSSVNSGVTNWTGASVVIRKNNFVTDISPVTSHSGGTLNYTSGSSYNGIAGYGFFIQNDVRTLDLQNEWYYNSSTKKLRIFSASSPVNVQVASIDTLVPIIGLRSFITFDGLTFSGSNKDAFTVRSAQNITIQNCTIDYSGKDAIWGAQNGGAASSTFIVQNNIINHTNNNAITLENEFAGCLIRGNTISNTGVKVGMGANGSGNYGTLIAVQIQANNATIEYNTLDSVGYHGIWFFRQNALIQYNYVDSFCLEKMDGGGIYCYNDAATGKIVRNNIVLDGHASVAGTTETIPLAHGIYFDEGTANVEVYGNTAANNDYSGFYYHSAYTCNFHDNTFYNNGRYQILFALFNASFVTNTNISLRNKFFSKTATQKVAAFQSQGNNIQQFGTMDNNYYARPIDDNLTIEVIVNANFGSPSNFNLAQWKTFSTKDANSQKSPRTITNVNQLDFEYNATASPVVKTLPPGNWVDVANTAYTGTTTLQPFTSLVLISAGGNIAPIANAGTNKNITLPTNSVSQVGSGTDADGTISAYLWTEFSGPGTYTIVSPTSATTTINNLVAGTYVFQLRVTDNQGATGSDTVTVVVNAAPPVNIPPIASAGGNKVITLPTSSVTQVGSGTDSDGTIVSYSWAKTSGPATFNIVSPTSATTVINGLTTAGTYGFTLTVTDNLGATGTQTATVLVNAAPNVNPTASAGGDQILTWPTNSTTLSGSGNDTDGSIVAYGWTKISGPAAYSITSPSSASTTITGLDLGVYQFQLQVTDNSGGTGTDVIQVTVNQGTVTINVTNTTVPFNNLPQLPTVTTNPAGVSYSITLNGVTGGRTQAGSYNYIVGITDPHWTFTPASGTFTITQATATINASDKTVNFDGNQQTITATTTPAGLDILSYLYDDNPTPPSAIGVYDVAISLANANYQASVVHVTLTIVSNPEIIFISDTLKTFNNTSQAVTVTSAWPYDITYNGSVIVPTNAGSYIVIVNINDGIHSGTDTATLTIARQPAVLSWTQPVPMPYGSQLTTLILNAQSNISGTWTYNYPLGTILPIGTTGLSATFTPTDGANYSGGVVSTTINIFGVNPFLDYFISSNGQFFFIEQ